MSRLGLILILAGGFCVVCSGLLLGACYVYESTYPVHDMHLLGLLATLSLISLLPLGVILIFLGLVFLALGMVGRK